MQEYAGNKKEICVSRAEVSVEASVPDGRGIVANV